MSSTCSTSESGTGSSSSSSSSIVAIGGGGSGSTDSCEASGSGSGSTAGSSAASSSSAFSSAGFSTSNVGSTCVILEIRRRRFRRCCDAVSAWVPGGGGAFRFSPALASSRSESFMESSSESPSSDSGSNVCTRGSESDSSSRRRLRAASLPARDAGDGEGSGDGSGGDATAGTSDVSASSTSIVAPARRSSSVGSDVDGAGWENDGGGLRQWPVDHAVFQGCRLIIRPSPFVGIFSNLWGAPLVPAPSAFGGARFAFVSAPPSPPRVSPPPGPPSSPTGATSSISIPLSSSKERGANSGVTLRARVEARKTSLERDSPGPVPHKARTRRAGRYAVRQLRRRPVRRQGWRRPWIRQRRPRRHDDARKGQGAAPPGTRLIFDTCMHTRPALAIAIPAIGFTSVPSTI